jgi:hypothetical protein
MCVALCCNKNSPRQLEHGIPVSGRAPSLKGAVDHRGSKACVDSMIDLVDMDR